MHVDDQALLIAWQGGDRRAGDQLFQRYFQQIRRFFFNKVTQGEDEELIQATFLGCVQAAGSFRGDASFRTYLFQIARHVLCDHFRKQHRQPGLVDFDEVSVDALLPGMSSVIARKREHTLLLHGLRQLSLNAQMILELYYWEDMTANQIGHILNLDEPAVRSRIRRAKEALEARLTQLARTPKELASTVDGLARWAGEIRARVAAPDGEDDGSDDSGEN